jgi:hypothetical protein
MPPDPDAAAFTAKAFDPGAEAPTATPLLPVASTPTATLPYCVLTWCVVVSAVEVVHLSTALAAAKEAPASKTGMKLFQRIRPSTL